MDKLTKSPKLNFLLGKMDIFTQYDVINYLPRRYDDFSITEERNLEDKAKVTVLAKVISSPATNKSTKVTITSFEIQTLKQKTYFRVIAFNRPYIGATIKKDTTITITGVFDKTRNTINMVSYSLGEIDENKRFKPVYSLPSQYPNHLFISLVKRSLDGLKGKIHSYVPYHYINKYHLIDKERALYSAHFPTSIEDIKQSHRLLKYEEALMFSLKNQLIRKQNKSLSKIKNEPIDLSSTEEFLKTLPYELTADQKKAAEEIIEDMNQSSLMYRLLQGDVGTGKTLVCFIALFANYKRGNQGVLMAPTDVLARQHYENAKKIYEKTKLRISLLVGSTSLKDKREIYDNLRDGNIDILIGTHAVFANAVEYSSLGLAIIDEQHRFGVNQRLALANKGSHADLLMLSATPIPRSLALSIYGDLEVSTLTSFPSKNRDIITTTLESDSDRIFKAVDMTLENNRMVYVVAPKINYDENGKMSVEQIYARYLLKYGNKVGLLHGKMTAKDKENVLNDFINGTTPILVSTQVIEVGIDVKKASLMVIYDANCFGLASLHQLRGRIGRDGNKSFCLLTYSNIDDEQLDRLNFLCKSNDGFDIAEYDLKTRGPGELTGLRQSGMPDFKFLNIINDFKIFVCGRDDAKEILENPNEPGNEYIIKKAERDIIFEPTIGG